MRPWIATSPFQRLGDDAHSAGGGAAQIKFGSRDPLGALSFGSMLASAVAVEAERRRRTRPGGVAEMDAVSERQAALLVITADELFGRALESVFTPAGYDFIHARTPTEAVERARVQGPDAVVLHADLLQADAPATFVLLRQFPELGRRTPLLVVSTTRLSPAERRRALRAGAWHLAEAPFNPEELALQLDVFVAAKWEAERYRDAAFLDPLTGLYTPRGIQYRAVELAALAARSHEPLACVVFSPAAPSSARDAVLESISRALRDLGRRSDAIGSLGDSQFAVVAIATPVQGATQLAERFASGVEERFRPQVRAGFDVAATVDKPAELATQLIDHARLAAAESAAGNGGEWLREYRPT